MAGKQNQSVLTPSVFVSENVKAHNNQILYTIENVAAAIQQKKKISFKLFNYNTDMASKWWLKFNSLPEKKLELAKSIIEKNHFEDLNSLCDDKEIQAVLRYYTISSRNEQ